jgi:hypothetical protein
MKTDKNELEVQNSELDIPVVINRRLLLNLLLFKDKASPYSKDTKIGIGVLLWLDVVGIILTIWSTFYLINIL